MTPRVEAAPSRISNHALLMPNALAHESSPYLLQHQNNPVDWRPWGPAALDEAKRMQKPIFLSIGYSACHWCHVMEHESFEDERIAALVNEYFVAIKVDREERPDLDQIYMQATQAMTGRGGWPMSVFLTPDLKPFYAGTYFPPSTQGGMPGFDDVLRAVHDAWTYRREHAEQLADQIAESLAPPSPGGSGPTDAPPRPTRKLIDAAIVQLGRAFDRQWGGFGRAPKFPHPMDLQLLLRQWRRAGQAGALDMVRDTLDRMAAGGIYDHLGGGFARYSVDERWLVPHFEKMLYDNALLAATYVEAWQATGEPLYERIARETLDYVLRDMTDADGGFYSTEDADSEGHEGLFYTWTPAELTAVLGNERAATFARVYDVTEEGNFEGRSILNLPKSLEQSAEILGRPFDELSAELASSRTALFAARKQRIHPHKDDKLIVAWNGLAIDAFARAGGALNEPRYTAAAAQASDFMAANLARPDGRLLHTWRRGRAKLDAYLDDYACLVNGLVSLYEATFDPARLAEAARLADVMLAHFTDDSSGNAAGGGFFFTADDHEQLISRQKDLTDASVPSSNGMAATALVRLGKLTGESKYLDAAESALAAAAPFMEQAPTAMGQSLLALDLLLGPTYELVYVGDHPTALAAIRRRYLPHKVLAAPPTVSNADNGVALLSNLVTGKTAVDGKPTLYLCEHFTCQTPAVGMEAIRAALDAI